MKKRTNGVDANIDESMQVTINIKPRSVGTWQYFQVWTSLLAVEPVSWSWITLDMVIILLSVMHIKFDIKMHLLHPKIIKVVKKKYHNYQCYLPKCLLA